MRSIRLRKRGFTLVELMIVVAIIGVLAALAIYGVSRYLAGAKTSEAKESVGAISRAADTAFKAFKQKAAILADGASGLAATSGLCGSATPVPAVPTNVKYQPNTAAGADFNFGDETTGWQCLKFYHDKPILYSYNYNSAAGYITPPVGGPNPGALGMEAAAKGNIDNDADFSYFARSGEVRNGNLVMADHLFVFQEGE